MIDITSTEKLNVEAKKAKAMELYERRKKLESELIEKERWELWAYKSKDEILEQLKEPKRISMLSKIGRLIQNTFLQTLYPSGSRKAYRAGLLRAEAILPLMLILLIMSLVAAGKALHETQLLLVTGGAAGLALGSAVYLGMAIWDYYKTPKEQRTPLQKFNMLSSMPSTLLVFGLAAAVVCASLAIPGAIFAVPAIAGVWLAYKAWQGNKGAALKQAETEKQVEELKAIEFSLNRLEQEPEIKKAVTAHMLETDLKTLRASETYTQITGYESRLVEALSVLKADAASTENKQTDSEKERALELDKAAPTEEAAAEASPAQAGFFAERRSSQDEAVSLLSEEEKSFTA